MNACFVLMKSEGDKENHYSAYSYGKAYVDKRIRDINWRHMSFLIPRVTEKDPIFINKTDYFLPYEYGKTVDDVVDLPVILKMISNYKRGENLLNDIEIPNFRKKIIVHIEKEFSKISNSDYIFHSVFRYHLFFHIYFAMLVKRQNPKCIISFGGPQIEYSYLTRKFLIESDFVDHLLIGDVESNLMDIFTGKVFNKIHTSFLKGDPEVPEYPFILPKLLPSLLLNTSRNCIHKCAYCPSANKDYKLFSLNYVEKCLERYEGNKIYITDPLFNPSNKRFNDILDLMLKYNFSQKYTMWLHFYGLNDSTIKKLGQLEPDKVWVSIDISSENLRQRMKRKSMNNWVDKLDSFVEYGLKPIVPFIISLPGESDYDFFKTAENVQFIKDRYGDNINIILFPYIYVPGASLINDRENYGIVTENWKITGYENFPKYYNGVNESTMRDRIKILNQILDR